jgi:hypothetical protein
MKATHCQKCNLSGTKSTVMNYAASSGRISGTMSSHFSFKFIKSTVNIYPIYWAMHQPQIPQNHVSLIKRKIVWTIRILRNSVNCLHT